MQAGYVTHYYGKGHTGYKSMNHLPARRGFHSSTLFLAGLGSYTTLPRWTGETPLKGNHQYSTDFFGSLAVQAVQNHDTTKPLFLYLPFQAVHNPYDLPPACPQRSDTLQCVMNDADVWVGKLVDQLKQKGMYDKTVIVYSTDNGGVELGNNYPLRGMKRTNWQGGMNGAAFVSGGFLPQSARGTQNYDSLHIVDWYPTFCGLAGVSADDGQQPPIDGKDAWPSLMGKTNFPRTLWLSNEVLLQGPYKLVVSQPAAYLTPKTTIHNGW